MLFAKRSWLPMKWVKRLTNRQARRRCRQDQTSSVEVLEVRAVMSAVALSATELAAMQVRVQKLTVDQFKTLQPIEVQFLTTAQLQSITTTKQLNAISADARGALSPDQVRQLNVGKTGLLGLTPGQIDSLTVAQIQDRKSVV